MIVLDGISDEIQVFMSGAAATTNPDFVVSYADYGKVFMPGRSIGVLNGATDVALVAGVAAAKRVVRSISICNLDTAAVNATVQINDGANDRVLVDAFPIPIGKTLAWTPETGWEIQPKDDIVVELGAWTPTLSFDTPGDLAITYSTQTGSYIKIGKLIRVTAIIVTSAFTHTTAAGNLQVGGLPFIVSNNAAEAGVLAIASWNSANAWPVNTTMLVGQTIQNTNHAYLRAMGNAVAAAFLTIANVATGTTPFIGGLNGVYEEK